MSRRKSSEQDDYSGSPETLSRKQVQDALRRGQSLAGRDMRGEDLSKLNFDNTDLHGAKLAEANLEGCTFRGADLSSASLWQANLSHATLDEANLEDADLDFAYLNGVTLRGARVKKTVFPLSEVPMKVIVEAVRTGAPLRVVRRRDPDSQA